MTAYYNEHDTYAAQWLRNLIDAGHIAAGVVDERSIEDVHPRDLDGFTQCHFFAGIGVWSYALRRAGWSDDRPVWTGSCPCQPFSAAGKGAGFADERHLWPAWHHLIRQHRPGVVFGEQVASKDGLAWLDLVQADMEGEGYAFGALDLCAAGVGAPHIRQRLYFVGDADAKRRGQRNQPQQARGFRLHAEHAVGSRVAGARQLADGSRSRLEGRDGRALGHERAAAERGGSAGALADHDAHRRRKAPGRELHDAEHHVESRGIARSLADAEQHADRSEVATADHGRAQADGSADWTGGRGGACGATRGFWAGADWIPCRDGKARPVEPGTFPLAHGAPARVGRLRAYGNAIVGPLAAEFIGAYLDIEA
jgi:DNA (cytosine-5)-methyltransferase 1